MKTPSLADRWQFAVELGGQGYYARARAELAAMRRAADCPVGWQSLTWSTEGSFTRQLGWHRDAAALDGRAFGLAFDSAGPLGTVAAVDALVGLAADALGQGRLALGHRLLDRARRIVAAAAGGEQSWRLAIRLNWVDAELALAAGDGPRAVNYAEAAVAAADRGPSHRHRIKSGLILAAALTVAGDARAGSAALTAFEQCRAAGLLPLQWAAALLTSHLTNSTAMSEQARRAAQEIRKRGGNLCSP